MSTICYSEDFINKAKIAFPEKNKVHELISQNDYSVGEHISFGGLPGIHYQDILSATSLEQLKDEAKKLKIRANLYSQWLQEVNHWTLSLAR